MIIEDTDTWTIEEVEGCENECSDYLLRLISFAKKQLKVKDYEMASRAFTDVVLGLKYLATIWPDYYEQYYYANYYVLAKVFAFGLYDRKMAETSVKMAKIIATNCATRGNTTARKDLIVISDVCSEFEKGSSISKINSIFNNNFPYGESLD